MAPSKAIIKMSFEIKDRIKVRGMTAFTSREWEPGTIIEIEEGLPTFAIIRFDNKYLGVLNWRLAQLQYEHTEEELVEQILGEGYFHG